MEETEIIKKKKLILGITGYTGCGKSFISQQIQTLLAKENISCRILDSDKIAKELRDSNEKVKSAILHLLGSQVYDSNGESIPSEINKIIFDEKNFEMKMKYQAIFHKEVNIYVYDILNNLNFAEDVIILDFYSIFTYLTPCLQFIDKFILVNSSANTQIERLVTKRNVDPELAMKRIQNQRNIEPLKLLEQRANYIIQNENTEEAIQAIQIILNELLFK